MRTTSIEDGSIFEDDSLLVGDIKIGGDWDDAKGHLFIKDLEVLMRQFCVHKIDVAWKMPKEAQDE